MHAEDGRFFGFDLLGRDFAIRGEQVLKNGTNIVGILTGGTIEQGSKVDGVDGGNDLRNERLLCGLTEVKVGLAFKPGFFGRRATGSGTGNGGSEGSWVDRANPRDRGS